MQQNSATRCQKCAYKKGLCAICGNIVLDTSREFAGAGTKTTADAQVTSRASSKPNTMRE